MAKKCLYLLLAGALLQMPAFVHADTPEEQIEQLKKELKEARKEIEKLRVEVEKLRKEKKWRDEQAEFERLCKEHEALKKELEALNERLISEYEKLLKERQPSDLPGEQLWDPPPREELKIPKPPRDIRGVITGVADNLATVSVGSDQGVKVDQIFQVYRLEPEPQYLGILKITNLETHRAAGRFTPATSNTKMKKGDTVTTKIESRIENKE